MDDTAMQDDLHRAMWNGIAGRNWIEAQPLLDCMFSRVEEMLAEAAVVSGARRVLDVGCGTGATTLALARRIGEAGRATGIDISGPMIALARQRAERAGLAADFVCADAQDHGFADETYDRIVSRFGVMFFRDPVLAFANLRRAAAHGARLHSIVWRDVAENPFMSVGQGAAAHLLPDDAFGALPPSGQFAFADPVRVRDILEASGWQGIAIAPVDIACRFPATGLETYFTRLGPLGRILPEIDEGVRARIVEAVRDAYAPFVEDGEVCFTAACWSVEAVNA